MLIWWGPEFCQLYSDAFLALAEDCQLQAEARAIGRRISAEKPGDFVRRMRVLLGDLDARGFGPGGCLKYSRMPHCGQFSEDRKEPSADLMGLRGPPSPRKP
jgi:hypothetical protein